MKKSNEYLYIQQYGVKVKLLAENDVWEWSVGDMKIKMRASLERELVYSLVTGDDLINFYELLRSCSRKLENYGMEMLRSEFANLHPRIECDDIELEDIPSYAAANGLEIPIAPKKSIIISKSDELRLMELITKETYCIRPAIDLFENLCESYGYNFSKKTGDLDQGDFLFRSFLHQHGLSYDFVWQRIWLEQNRRYKRGILPIEQGIIDNPDDIKDEDEEDSSIIGVIGFVYSGAFIVSAACISCGLAFVPMLLHIIASGYGGVFRTNKSAVINFIYGMLSAALFGISSLCIWQKDNIQGVAYGISFSVSAVLIIYSWLTIKNKW